MGRLAAFFMRVGQCDAFTLEHGQFIADLVSRLNASVITPHRPLIPMMRLFRYHPSTHTRAFCLMLYLT
jgi:hypothetical protein